MKLEEREGEGIGERERGGVMGGWVEIQVEGVANEGAGPGEGKEA